MNQKRLRVLNNRGFTLIELLLAMVISGIVAGAIYTSYRSQQESYVANEQIAAMQQNLRPSLIYMARDIRMAGFDPDESGNFGITNIQLDAAGNGAITFTLDSDLDDDDTEATDGNGDVDAGETFSYSIYDYPTASPDGNLDLARTVDGVQQLLAQNIVALGFAYAFDDDDDGELDTSVVGGNVIWAVDRFGNDNLLDTNLDTTDDGNIDNNDDPDGVPIANVDLDSIRAIRIWLLARTDREDQRISNRQTYVVANQRITPNDGFRRQLLTCTIGCRNLVL